MRLKSKMYFEKKVVMCNCHDCCALYKMPCVHEWVACVCVYGWAWAWSLLSLGPCGRWSWRERFTLPTAPCWKLLPLPEMWVLVTSGVCGWMFWHGHWPAPSPAGMGAQISPRCVASGLQYSWGLWMAWFSWSHLFCLWLLGGVLAAFLPRFQVHFVMKKLSLSH